MSGTDIAAPPGPAQLAARLAPIVISGSTTATINRTHLVVATATLSDPTPAEGAGFEVIVRNGTATVGGTAYAAGVKVRRYYHSGAWGNAVEPSIGAASTATRLTEWDASRGITDSAIADGVSGAVLTLSATLTGNRTWTVPDRADTFAGLAAQTFTGVQTFAAGSASAPSLALVDSGLGFYRVSANVGGFAASGRSVARLEPTLTVWSANSTDIASIGSYALAQNNFIGADGVACFTALISFGAACGIVSRRANGTAASPTGVSSGDVLHSQQVAGRTSAGAYTAGTAYWRILTTEAWSGTATGYEQEWYTTPNGTTTNTKRLALYQDGGMQLGGTYGTSPGTGGLAITGAFLVKKTAIVSAAGTTAIATTDHFVVVTGTTTHTLTLPAAVDGKQLLLKNRSTGTVTVNRAGADTIDGGTTFNLTAGQGTTLVCNSTDWCRVSNA